MPIGEGGQVGAVRTGAAAPAAGAVAAAAGTGAGEGEAEGAAIAAAPAAAPAAATEGAWGGGGAGEDAGAAVGAGAATAMPPCATALSRTLQMKDMSASTTDAQCATSPSCFIDSHSDRYDACHACVCLGGWEGGAEDGKGAREDRR